MNSYLSDRPILDTPLNYRRMRVVPSARVGYFLWLFDNDEVLSIQPDGTEDTRDPGTDGGYEQSLISGTRAIWDYDGLVDPIIYDCVVLPE